ncbi:hypothetical protein ACWOFI_07735, partial [Aerococcus christensenii]
IVPGQVTFSMNCRHTDASYLNQFLQELEEEIYATADHYGIEAGRAAYLAGPGRVLLDGAAPSSPKRDDEK